MSKTGARRVGKMAMGVAAVGVATTVGGVAATNPASISSPLVDLSALIVVGSSTHPDGSGTENFFQGKFNASPYVDSADDVVHVNFLDGADGIDAALQAHAGEQNAILASGWGAANASLLLRRLNAEGDERLAQTLLILDNDVALPDGGFGTRYPWFALIGVNPLPTPTDTLASAVVEVAYEYDYNSNAPADAWNLLAAVNSLVAYLYRHLNQAELNLPVDVYGAPVTCGADTCGVTDSGEVHACPEAHCDTVPAEDRVAAYVTKHGNTTYVTYTSDGLPLANLIRDVVPFGNFIADLTEPVLKLLVDSAYYGGNPIPADPSKYRPARPFPPLDEVVTTALKIPGAIQQGLTAVTSDESAASTTSATELAPAGANTAAGPSTTVEEKPKATLEEKPKLHVVRDSEKAVPGSPSLEHTSTTDPQPVTSGEITETSVTPKPTETAADDVIKPATDSNTTESTGADDNDDAGAA